MYLQLCTLACGLFGLQMGSRGVPPLRLFRRHLRHEAEVEMLWDFMYAWLPRGKGFVSSWRLVGRGHVFGVFVQRVCRAP